MNNAFKGKKGWFCPMFNKPQKGEICKTCGQALVEPPKKKIGPKEKLTGAKKKEIVKKHLKKGKALEKALERFGHDFPLLPNVPEALESSDEEYKSANSIWVPQKYAGFVAHSEEGRMKRYLGTFGMGPCIALVFYDIQTRSGMVAHFDSDGAKAGPYNAKNLALKLSNSFKKIIVLAKHFKVWVVLGSAPDIVPGPQFRKGSTPAVVDAINDVFTNMPCKNKACNSGCSYEKYKSFTGDILLDLTDGNLYEITNLHPFIEPKAKSDLFRWITTKEEGDDQMPAYHFNRWLVERGKGNISSLIFRLKGPLYVNKNWHHQNDTDDTI